MRILGPILILLATAACAPTALLPEAASVEIVDIRPNSSSCKLLGEVIGSQGDVFTAELTSNKNLILGARNALRNETSKLGGNVVYVHEHITTGGQEGIANTTIVGKAYKCTR